MPGEWLLIITISLVIIASNVYTANSECYVAGEISKSLIKYPQLKDCLNLTEINCGKDSPELSTTDLLDISGEENGQEKLKLEYPKWDRKANLVAPLNISVRNIWCKKFTIRISNDMNESLSTCHTVEFNSTRSLTMSLFTFVLQKHQMTTEFFIEADGETKFRKYIFIPPDLGTFNLLEKVKTDQIFNYLDMSDSAKVQLYIQPFDESFNVTKYDVRVICANECVNNFIYSINESYYDWKTAKGKNGSCYFSINPIIDASKCAKPECTTSSAVFVLYFSDNLLIMVVSLPVALFALFIALRFMYRYYAKRTWSRRERPNCLLVYSNTHKEHIKVIIKLAEYLRACRINAMIHELDAPNVKIHNPYIWYHKAFQNATTVIITASPPYTGDWPSPYQDLDKLALTLVQSNLHLNNKDYISVKFPHCKRLEDIPLEGRSFKSFKLPKDLDKLVERIQKIDYTKICKIPKDDFLISLKTAKEIICNQRWKSSVESSKSGMEPFPVHIKSYTSKESINISVCSTDDDGAWLGIKKDEEEEEVEIVEDEEGDDSVLW